MTDNDPQTPFLHSKILYFSSSRSIDYAYQVFQQVENPNAFMRNALIRARAQSSDHKEEAISLLRGMLEDGRIFPDKYIFPFALEACADLFTLSERSAVWWNALMDALVRFGEFIDAMELFHEMQKIFAPDGFLHGGHLCRRDDGVVLVYALHVVLM
ncbi:pentatricopeptide repeat-containing protein At1g59720, chloroplastic/mitochondrial-like [Eucalyptus grandis]|uniref:pentatricopeptide repeat-containing protein At1g59720, chloroplastic/mitochondrial-like n=1 Tax=Eucalyptus grandis TaxID=71139 RepID=UPI00192E8CCA|nr:pentatricopeptide repeat-containing protein At1g59720, chloroplastic/mitochondrial-like [Eucalyptus grandis]